MVDTDTNAAPVTTSRWVYGVDTLRFVLAVVVLLSHMANPFLNFKNSSNILLRVIEMAYGSLFNGAAAVITFFIISGFVIHFPNRKENSSINTISFLIRRVLRIGLPLVVVAAVANYYGYFSLVPIWSLYCELAYYAIYPILFSLKISWKKIFITSFMFALCIMIFFNFNGVLSAFSHKNVNYQGDYWMLGPFGTILIGLPCWLLGVLLAERIDALNYEVSFYNLLAYRLGVWAISVLLVICRFHVYIGYIFTFNFFALLLVKWLEKEVVYYKKNKHSGFLESFGKFSYTLYLWGGLMILFFAGFIPFSAATYGLLVLMVIFSSYLLYLVTEYPSHKLAQKASAVLGNRLIYKIYQTRYQKNKIYEESSTSRVKV